MKYQVTFARLAKKNINRIKSMWEKLNEIHRVNSIDFKKHFQTFTFEQRIGHFTHVTEENIQIEIVQVKNQPAGYCISTVSGKKGEIESLFVEEEYRDHGLGEKLVSRGILWLKERGCSKITVSVSIGNERVFPFYKKMGFLPRMTSLELVNSGD